MAEIKYDWMSKCPWNIGLFFCLIACFSSAISYGLIEQNIISLQLLHQLASQRSLAHCILSQKMKLWLDYRNKTLNQLECGNIFSFLLHCDENVLNLCLYRFSFKHFPTRISSNSGVSWSYCKLYTNWDTSGLSWV